MFWMLTLLAEKWCNNYWNYLELLLKGVPLDEKRISCPWTRMRVDNSWHYVIFIQTILKLPCSLNIWALFSNGGAKLFAPDGHFESISFSTNSGSLLKSSKGLTSFASFPKTIRPCFVSGEFCCCTIIFVIFCCISNKGEWLLLTDPRA